MPSASFRGSGNSRGSKSPTVRLHTSRPPAIAARTSAAMRRTSEPINPRASFESERSLMGAAARPRSVGVRIGRNLRRARRRRQRRGARTTAALARYSGGMASVGTSVARKEGMDRATGAAKYADDLRFPGMLTGRTIRSGIACGRVTGVTLDFDTAGFTVGDHRDIPGENTIALIEKDQPCLVNGVVRHAAEPILLLAHEHRDALVAANVRIDYERETPTFDPARSGHVFKHILIEKGNLERGFARAEVVVEGTYE